MKKQEPNAFVRLKESMTNRSKGKREIKMDGDRGASIISTDVKEDKGGESNNDKNTSEESKSGRVLERVSRRSIWKNNGNCEKDENGEVSEKNKEKDINGKVPKDKVNGFIVLNDSIHLMRINLHFPKKISRMK